MILLSVVLGIIEGLTEFLPVSSTAHLRIAQDIFHISLKSDYWKMYTIVIQLGAVLSLLLYFWKRILVFLATFPKGERGDKTALTHPISLVLIAFVLTAGPAWLLSKKIGDNLEKLSIIGTALIVGGIIMWIVDAAYRKPRILHIEEMGIFRAAWIGVMQILSAVFPGTSRSMITIAAGQVVEMSRPAALEFSFFLSIPTMLAATLYSLLKSLKSGDAAKGAPEHKWLILAIGFVVSFVVALGVVHWFMGWVAERGFAPFAVYRILLGIGVLIWAWKQHS